MLLNSYKWRLAGLTAAVFVLISAQVAVRGKLTAPTPDFNEQMRMARYLVHGSGFVCPVGPERDDPSSWYAPGYIAMMAGLLAVFGEDTAVGLAAIRLVNIAALSVSFVLCFLVGLKLFGRKVAWAALILMLLSPGLMFKAHEIWDTSLTTLAGTVLLVLFVIVRPKRPIAILASGLACGGAAMINPTFTICYPVWVIYSWWQGNQKQRRIPGLLRYSALVLIGFILSILPWTMRNYLTFGDLFYIRGNLPLEIWSGNAPWSDGYGDSAGGNKPHPVFHDSESQRMVELGEYGYFRACRQDVQKWWQEDKARFARLTQARIKWFWFGRYDFDTSRAARAVKMASVAGTTVLAIIGTLIILWKRRSGLVLVLSVAVFPLMYYITQIMMRYRLPIEPVILLLAAVGLAGLWPERSNPPSESLAANDPAENST